MPSTTTLIVLLAPVILFTIWHISSTISPPPIPSSLYNKRIILLIAHPDDESMFFSPALQALTDPALGNHVKILCLSTGDADGLGETRRKELESAALTLGLRQSQDVFVMDDERFKDGMNETWAEKDIARVLAQAFAPQLITNTSQTSTTAANDQTTREKSSKTKTTNNTSSKSSSKTKSTTSQPPPPSPSPSTTQTGPKATIDIILTFDQNGISSHPNHISLYHGSRLFLQNIMKGHRGHSCPVSLYTLRTTNILRKYSFFLDVIPTYINTIIGTILDTSKQSASMKARSKEEKRADRIMFVSDLSRYIKARRAMVHGHKSQMVWFRWGWIGLGRYMVINDLKREMIIAT
jgi:N-acetylglucosaminylphosphatidylinositol deacetylase